MKKIAQISPLLKLIIQIGSFVLSILLAGYTISEKITQIKCDIVASVKTEAIKPLQDSLNKNIKPLQDSIIELSKGINSIKTSIEYSVKRDTCIYNTLNRYRISQAKNSNEIIRTQNEIINQLPFLLKDLKKNLTQIRLSDPESTF